MERKGESERESSGREEIGMVWVNVLFFEVLQTKTLIAEDTKKSLSTMVILSKIPIVIGNCKNKL